MQHRLVPCGALVGKGADEHQQMRRINRTRPECHCVMLVQVTSSMVSTQENMKGRQASGTENGRPAQGYNVT